MYQLPVLITIDTEVWPHSPTWQEEGLEVDFERDIIGRTTSGDFGIQYQLDVFARHGLRAVFLVEGLFADAVGPEPLERIVRKIYASDQEVQLHAHPEWLRHLPQTGIPSEGRKYLHEFTLRDQATLLGRALSNLTAAGAMRVNAFRAGNYGANLDTLRALASLGIEFDTSHNPGYLGGACRLSEERMLLRPESLGGVMEYPVSYLLTFGGRVRHAQLMATSFSELRYLLEQAWIQRWQSVVIVSHSFELLDRRGAHVRARGPDSIVVRRFEQLCAWLEAHRDRFVTRGFHGAWLEPCTEQPEQAVVCPVRYSASRVLEQSYRRVRP